MTKYVLTKDIFIVEHLKSIFADILTIDIVDETQNGILFLDARLLDKEVLKLNNKYSIVVMSEKPSFKEGVSLLPFGIKGYINAHMDATHYGQLMGVVEKGSVWLYPEFMQELICNYIGQSSKSNKLLNTLTPREEGIASLVSEGLGNKDIARKLDISEGTVKQHLMKIFKKLNVQNRIELALMCKKSVI